MLPIAKSTKFNRRGTIIGCSLIFVKMKVVALELRNNLKKSSPSPQGTPIYEAKKNEIKSKISNAIPEIVKFLRVV